MHRRSSSGRRKWPFILLIGAAIFGVLFALKNFDVPQQTVEQEIPYAKLPK